jgi:hypothetical protein
MDDHDDWSGNGQLSFSVQAHTGRNGRKKQFDLTNDNGDAAEIIIDQEAASRILAIDRFEDSNGNTVQVIDHVGGLYYMCGHANVDFLEASEGSTMQTDLNDQSGGTAWTQGFTITEADGTVHTGNIFEQVIPYGTDAQYTFKIPILFLKTNTRIEVAFSITDDIDVVNYSIVQEGE